MNTRFASPRFASLKQAVQVVLGCLIAGALMGEREQFTESWQRALAAGAAAICVVLVGQKLRENRAERSRS
ncbi:hypothetical protein SAMN02745166_01858 [Prosthecobacter debontii]|uniref:Uncharacterized protein n=1 Tax=Prosthecobacter debontii TaxID=48467 RepID=A0A1T4XS65_9BACT|nr:hypothetical protein [Prosthecobacter debontii]SKA92213.1 hypothetical protein SAMN02745166_01858 [Prosthecobacter debontii]